MSLLLPQQGLNPNNLLSSWKPQTKRLQNLTSAETSTILPGPTNKLRMTQVQFVAAIISKHSLIIF